MLDEAENLIPDLKLGQYPLGRYPRGFMVSGKSATTTRMKFPAASPVSGGGPFVALPLLSEQPFDFAHGLDLRRIGLPGHRLSSESARYLRSSISKNTRAFDALPVAGRCELRAIRRVASAFVTVTECSRFTS